MNTKINLDYFLTINPLAEFTEEVKDYLKKHFCSFVYCVEHKNSNAHVHIIAHEHKRTMLRKSLNDDMKKKFPNLKGTKLVIKDVTSKEVYYYICKEYNEKDFQLYYFNYNIPEETQKKYFELYTLSGGKSYKEKFNFYFKSNEQKYLNPATADERYSMKELVLFAFMEFLDTENIKDVGPYAFEKYFYYLLQKCYKREYFQHMLYATMHRMHDPNFDYQTEPKDNLYNNLVPWGSNPDEPEIN